MSFKIEGASSNFSKIAYIPDFFIVLFRLIIVIFFITDKNKIVYLFRVPSFQLLSCISILSLLIGICSVFGRIMSSRLRSMSEILFRGMALISDVLEPRSFTTHKAVDNFRIACNSAVLYRFYILSQRKAPVGIILILFRTFKKARCFFYERLFNRLLFLNFFPAYRF